MAKLNILFLLIVVSSVACTLGEKSNDVAIGEAKESSTEQLSPKDELFLYTFKHFKNISQYYVNRAENISQHILKDDTIVDHSSSPEIQAFQKNLTHFLEKYSNYSEVEELFDLVDIFANATEFYMELPKEAKTSDTEVIIATLKKFGSDKLEQKFEELFNSFVEDFKQQFEAAKASLKEEKVMLEWFDQLKALTTADDKINAFDKFFTFYSTEN